MNDDTDEMVDVANDERKFNEIVIKYSPRIYRIVRGMLGIHEDADDVVQETFIKAYKSMGDFRGEADIGTWLVRIAINKTIDRTRRKNIFSTTPSEDYAKFIPAEEATPEEDMVEKERREIVREGLSILPEKQRAVFILRMYDDMAFRQIAETTGTTEGAARANFHHALKKLSAYTKKEVSN